MGWQGGGGIGRGGGRPSKSREIFDVFSGDGRKKKRAVGFKTASNMNVLIFLSVVNTYTVGIRPLFCSDLPVAFDPSYLHHSRVLLIHHA